MATLHLFGDQMYHYVYKYISLMIMFKDEKKKMNLFCDWYKRRKNLVNKWCHISEIGYIKTWYLRVQKIHQCMKLLQEEK